MKTYDYNTFLKNTDKAIIGKREFCISLKDTHKIDIAVSNHDVGTRRVFAEISGKKNVSLDFDNSEFTVDGRITPFVLKDCKNVKLKNFKIKFKNRYYLQAEIVDSTPAAVILSPNSEENAVIKNSILTVVYDGEELAFNGTFYAQEFEKEFKVARKSNIRIYDSSVNRFEIKDGLIYLFCEKSDSFKKGNYLCLFCEPRTADCILIDNCENVVIENLTVYSSPSMGIMCQLSKNIKLLGVKVIKEESSCFGVTTLADATHFFACRGKVVIKDCVFENMNDDATNIHGIYQTVLNSVGNEITAELKHKQQCGVNSYKKGDVVAVLDGKTKLKKAAAKVVSSKMIKENECRLILDKEICAKAGDIVENLSANPKITISRLRTGNNRPRGVLVASNRKTVVKNCEFYSSECGVGVFADTDFWYESGAVKNVKIIGNKFRCNYGGGESAVHVLPSAKYCGKYFNEKIVVKNNTFDLSYGKAVSAVNTEKIVLKNNRCINADGAKNIQTADCGKINGRI